MKMERIRQDDDLDLEGAVLDAFPREVVLPRELAGRIRVAVHAEAGREPLRRRRSLVFRMSLSFACACMAGYVMSARIRQARTNADHEKHPYFAGPLTVNPRVTETPGPGVPVDATPHNDAFGSSVPSAPILTGAVTPEAAHLQRRAMERLAPIWTHQCQPIVEVPAERETDDSSMPSTIRISVTDPSEQQIRSLQLSRELRDGDVYADLHYTARPILTSAGN